MKPARFDYALADSAEEAVALLAEYGDAAAVLAGGQSLVPMLNMRLASPSIVVDIGKCSTLDYVRASDQAIEIGALFRQAGLERWRGTGETVPLLALALPHIGHYQTCSRGTVGGSVAHADPSAEIPLILATLGGAVELCSTRGRRNVPAREFFLGALDTARQPDELLTAVHVPIAGARSGVAFREVSLRHGDFALVAVTAVVDGSRVTLGAAGVADRPIVREWPSTILDDVPAGLAALSTEFDFMSDQHADERYRRRLLLALGEEVIAHANRARELAQGSNPGPDGGWDPRR